MPSISKKKLMKNSGEKREVGSKRTKDSKPPRDFLVNPAQKRNPILKKFRKKMDFDEKLKVHFFLKNLNIGVDYLDLKFFKNHRQSLFNILDYSKGGERGENIGRVNYLALVSNAEEDDSDLIEEATIMAYRFGFRVLIFANESEFLDFFNSLLYRKAKEYNGDGNSG